MDWIEKLFGLSPDGGDGSTELSICVALVVPAVFFLTRAYQKRQRAKQDRLSL